MCVLAPLRSAGEGRAARPRSGRGGELWGGGVGGVRPPCREERGGGLGSVSADGCASRAEPSHQRDLHLLSLLHLPAGVLFRGRRGRAHLRWGREGKAETRELPTGTRPARNRTDDRRPSPVRIRGCLASACPGGRTAVCRSVKKCAGGYLVERVWLGSSLYRFQRVWQYKGSIR